MSQQTEVCKKIIENIQKALVGACCPTIMIENILNAAHKMADEGYVWDVALAKACQIYQVTKYCAEEIW
jgi:hypothetical protein